MSAAYAALAEPHRRAILDLLREAGLVSVRAEGRVRQYALAPAPLAEVDAWLGPYRAFWSERLDALERHLEEHP